MNGNRFAEGTARFGGSTNQIFKRESQTCSRGRQGEMTRICSRSATSVRIDVVVKFP